VRLWKLGVLAIGGLAVAGSNASAGDLAAPPWPGTPLPNWTGFYAGLNAGAGWNDDPVHFINGDPADFGPAILAGAVPSPLTPGARGFVGGGQVGYNLQSGPVVYGIETDFQYADVNGTSTALKTTAGFPTLVLTAENKLEWVGTLRPRAGITFGPALLVYVTGGLAYGEAESSASTTIIGPNGTTCGTSPLCSIGSASVTRAGWTAGFGAEYALSPSWSVKLEYLFYDLGHLTYNMPSTLTPTAGMQGSVPLQENLARAAFNYKF